MRFEQAYSFEYQDDKGMLGTAASLSIDNVGRLITGIINHEAAVANKFNDLFRPEARDLYAKLSRHSNGVVVIPDDKAFFDSYAFQHTAATSLKPRHFATEKLWNFSFAPGVISAEEINGEYVEVDVGSLLPKPPRTVEQIEAIAKTLPDTAENNSGWTKQRFRSFVDGLFERDKEGWQKEAKKLLSELRGIGAYMQDEWRLRNPAQHANFVSWLVNVRDSDLCDIKERLQAASLPPLVLFTEAELRGWTADPADATIMARGLFNAWSEGWNNDIFNWMSPETQQARHCEMTQEHLPAADAAVNRPSLPRGLSFG